MQRRKQQERKKVCPHGNQSKENCYFCQMEADNGYSDNNEIERIRSSSRLSNQRKMRTVSPSFFDYDQNIALSMTTGHGLSRHWCSFFGETKISIPLSHHSNASQSRKQSRRDSSLG